MCCSNECTMGESYAYKNSIELNFTTIRSPLLDDSPYFNLVKERVLNLFCWNNNMVSNIEESIDNEPITTNPF